MIPASGLAGIRIDAKPGLPLQAGEYVSLKVIKRIMGNKWALGLKGQVLAARSEIELIPGETIRAQVSRVGRQIFFKINSKSENRLETFIAQSGLALDSVSKQIVAAMLRSGLTLDPAMIHRIRELVVRRPVKLSEGHKGLIHLPLTHELSPPPVSRDAANSAAPGSSAIIASARSGVMS